LPQPEVRRNACQGGGNRGRSAARRSGSACKRTCHVRLPDNSALPLSPHCRLRQARCFLHGSSARLDHGHAGQPGGRMTMGLLAAISKRLGQALVLLFIMSLIGFIGIHSVGNPVFNIVDMDTATAEDIRNATVALGLDQPVWRQYLIFVQSLLTGSFGTSYIYHQPAFALVMSKLPATFELASVAMLIAAPTGVLLGLLAGRRHG